MNIVLVFLGGGVGALLRYLINLLFLTNCFISTVTVNVIGCFLIAVLNKIFINYPLVYGWQSSELRLLLITGLLGGFTTYSSFALDFFNLAKDNYLSSLFYFFITTFLGFLSFGVGSYFIK